jgi:copper chaperone CopZ
MGCCVENSFPELESCQNIDDIVKLLEYKKAEINNEEKNIEDNLGKVDTQQSVQINTNAIQKLQYLKKYKEYLDKSIDILSKNKNVKIFL